jgi:hypothetical protein
MAVWQSNFAILLENATSLGTAKISITCALVASVKIENCHRLATDLLGEFLAKSCIDTGGSIRLHIRNECHVDRQSGADARMASPLADDLDVNSVHQWCEM